MSCEEHADAIGELVEGTLSPSARAAVEAHVEACAACRGLVADLRRIHLAAQALPRLKPPEDGWSHLAERMKRERQPTADARAATVSPGRLAWLRLPSAWMRPVPVLAAATLVIAVATGLLLLRGINGPAPLADRRGAPAQDRGASAQTAQSVAEELRLAEQHYERAIVGLEQITKAGEGALDPQVAATLRKNLSVIDQAIQDSRAALQTQPTSVVAQEGLFDLFRRKVALLQDTVALINEMRKGNQAGTAKILGNLDKS